MHEISTAPSDPSNATIPGTDTAASTVDAARSPSAPQHPIREATLKDIAIIADDLYASLRPGWHPDPRVDRMRVWIEDLDADNAIPPSRS